MINKAKGLATFHDKTIVLDKKLKTQQQNQNANIKILARAGNRTRKLSHRGQVRYH